MEVCGGQTHGLLRYGIDVELSGVIELIHGPGCPVCVTDIAAIDHALDLAHRPQCAAGELWRYAASPWFAVVRC
jgi:hydrogenase expression/formation protein HypD